jgi:hypothetical protein
MAHFVQKTVYGTDARAMSLRAWLVQREWHLSTSIDKASG